MMEKVQQFFASHPEWAGVLIVAIGVFFLLACIFDWQCVFGNVSPVNYSVSKVDGLVNFFGRKTARVICAIVASGAIIGGIVWIWIYLK